MYFSGISHIFCCWALLIPPQLFTAFACDSPHLVLALAVVKDRHFRVQVYLSETCHHWTVLLISSVWSQVLWAELCDLVSGLYLSYISMRKVTGFPFPYIVALTSCLEERERCWFAKLFHIRGPIPLHCYFIKIMGRKGVKFILSLLFSIGIQIRSFLILSEILCL